MSVRPNALTATDMADLMAKLAANFGGKKDLEARTDVYFDRLERFPFDVVRKAVNRILDEEHKYFPVVGRIKAYCVELERDLGIVDDSPRASLRAWEANPYANVVSGADSDPCPVCGERLVFAPRGIVIVHDDAKHTEAHVSYSNAGRPEWFTMGPPVMPEPKKKLKQLAAAPVGAIVTQVVPSEEGDAKEPE